MTREVYRYRFAESAPMDDVEATLVLAIMAVESLHGQSEVRLDGSHYLDAGLRTCVIDGSSAVGRDLNRLFVGFVAREYGTDSFQVERVNETQWGQTSEAADSAT